FSPSWACTDTEHQVVEMLFESLVKLSPDSSGVSHYNPGLAEGKPREIPLSRQMGREFRLPKNATWSNRQPLAAADILHSWNMLDKGRLPGWGELIDRDKMRGGSSKIEVSLRQGYLDPLAPFTFKIIPDGSNPDTSDFATKPVTSGPFLLDRQRSEA